MNAIAPADIDMLAQFHLVQEWKFKGAGFRRRREVWTAPSFTPISPPAVARLAVLFGDFAKALAPKDIEIAVSARGLDIRIDENERGLKFGGRP